MLWILDASINVSMEPFRAFVADILPEGQRTAGFAMQSLFIGLGAVVASALPWLLTNVFHMHQDVGDTRAVPTDRAPLVLRRRCGVHRRGAVDDRHDEGISAGGYGGVSQGKGRERRLVANAQGDLRARFARCRRPCASLARCSSSPGWDSSACGSTSRWPWRTTSSAPAIRARRYTRRAWSGAAICFAVYSLVCFAFSFALPGLARQAWPEDTRTACACSAERWA